MKQILTIAENKLFQNDTDGNPVTTHELIFVWSETAYSVGLAGDVIRDAEVGTFRFFANDDQIKAIVGGLLRYTERDEVASLPKD